MGRRGSIAGMAVGRDGALRQRSWDGSRPGWGIAAAQPGRQSAGMGRCGIVAEMGGTHDNRPGSIVVGWSTSPGMRQPAEVQRGAPTRTRGSRDKKETEKLFITKLACGARKTRLVH
jgi:IS5 family transposase